jgi:hypothetical protein
MVGLTPIVLLTALLFCLAGSMASAQTTGCTVLGNNITHVVYIEFDNVHFERDKPNVLSDLEQMPNLLNFLKNNGALLTNNHTPLISHTADDILTGLTGVYPDRHGEAVSNSYNIFNKTGNSFWDSFPSSFTYWTNQVSTNSLSDTQYNLIAANGKNAPAPWAVFTKAGCNVGAVSIADLELENNTSDITNVFGAGSPESLESAAQKVLDFEGIAIHCAAGDPVCAATGKPDVLPQEPNGYANFKGLFGHKYAVPAITSPSSTTITDLDGGSFTGFPGFSGITAAQALAYTASMLEHNVPIVFTYIADAHDCHFGTGNAPACNNPSGISGSRAFGPGELPYVQQLKNYDRAFGAFFTRLANDGITPANTVFVITSDEQDHFAGSNPNEGTSCTGQATVDGNNNVTGGNFCTYTNAGNGLNLGEVDAYLGGLINQQFPSLSTSVFDLHFDMAPAIYLQGFGPNGTTPTGNTVASTNPTLPRQFERATARLTATSPITGNIDQLTHYQIDQAGMAAIHMITADAQRTPNYIMFGNPDYFFEGTISGCTGCTLQESPSFAWNHGGYEPEIYTTWVGLVGPGVANVGQDNTTWADHVDTRATMLQLAGLIGQDDYLGDGRVLTEDLQSSALPSALDSNYTALAESYKQVNAPVGLFGKNIIQLSTDALASGSSTDDSEYTAIESAIGGLTTQRNALAGTIIGLLQGAEVNNTPIPPATMSSLVATANSLTGVGAHPAISLAFSPATIAPNGSSTLTYTISNGNAIPFTGLAFTASLPTGLTVASPSNLTDTCGGAATGTTLAGGWILNGPGATCSVSVNVTASAVGNYSASANVSSSINGAGNPGSASLTVLPAPTLTLSSSGSPSLAGQPVAFIASIVSSGVAPTGTVTFNVDNGASVIPVPIASGTAVLDTSELSAGTHTLIATYSGDTNWAPVTSATLTQVVDQSTTTVTVRSSVNPSNTGQPVALTTSISFAFSIGVTPTGTVTFNIDNGASIIPVPIIGGHAELDTAALSAGTHSIVATYSGDTNLAAATSAAFTQIVNQATPTVTVVSSSTTSTVGQPVSFIGSLNVAGVAPTGTITFNVDNGTSIIAVPVRGVSAELDTATLTAGPHYIVATYSGDTNWATATSAKLTQTVRQGTPTVTLQSSANPSSSGQGVGFVATVNVNGVAPTGTVTFNVDNGAFILPVPLIGLTAELDTSELPSGTHTIVATYNGDANWATATSPTLTQTVN